MVVLQLHVVVVVVVLLVVVDVQVIFGADGKLEQDVNVISPSTVPQNSG